MSEPDRQGAIEQDDLFDRWLAYHARQIDADEAQHAADLDAADDEDVVVSTHRPSSDMDRQVPGFEPIVMPSIARRRELAANPPKRGLRLSRARAEAEKKSGAATSGVRMTTQLPPPPPIGRRLTRSISGEEPEWLTSLRAAANTREAVRPESPAGSAGSAGSGNSSDIGGRRDRSSTREPMARADVAPLTTTAPVVDDQTDETDEDRPAGSVSPAEAAGMGWLDIIRDSSPRTATREPDEVDELAEDTDEDDPEAEPDTDAGAGAGEFSSAADVRVLRVARVAPAGLDPEPAIESAPDPNTRPDGSAPPSWATALRAATITPLADPDAAVASGDTGNAGDTATDSATTPDRRSRLRAVPVEPVHVEPEPVEPEHVEPEHVEGGGATAVGQSDAAIDAAAEPDVPAAEPEAESRPEPAAVAVRTLRIAQARRAEPAQPAPLTQPEQLAPPAPAIEPAQPAQSAPAEPAARPALVAGTSPIETVPDVYEFKRHRTLRTVATVLLAAGVIATAYLASAVYRDPTQSSVAVAALAGFVTAVVWALRATTTVTRLTVRSGQLEVAHGDGRFTIDLTRRDTPLELVGTPGQRGWRALYLRHEEPPFEITAAMVDPVDFDRVVRHYRSAEPSQPPDPAKPTGVTAQS